MPLSELGSFLNLLIGGVFVAVLTATVAAIRRLKSGAIVDDDAVIARLDADNVKLRRQNAEKDQIIETERRARWRAEDLAAIWKRQLQDEGHVPIQPAPLTIAEEIAENDSRT